ncbi:Sulfoacetaldehyde acetyltransferase [Diplonema papillatum]|nr:Sulfoacetaldehyde acetyltransferase [Diplonema papillatum]KAJ9446783.1 Sulfoacetaldehyde acetyltransferase [Diplonema papillatum]
MQRISKPQVASRAASVLRSMRCGSNSNEPTLMTNSEAFVETLVSRDVKVVFGIVGSAFMDALDLFPAAGIRFLSVQHEQGAAHMADGYARVTGKHGVCIGQNGPGITNFVTGVAAAYWTGSPVIAITPEAATMTKGLGGFQECDQLPIFETITKEQVHVVNPARMAELTGYAFDSALRENGPVQLNIPRDFFYGENKFKIPRVNLPELSAGGTNSVKQAAELLRGAKNPVLVVGGGVVNSCTGYEVAARIADYLQTPVATTYLHNDAYNSDSNLWVGPLGYCGHKAAMHCVSEADVVLALGTRLGPFGANPQYGFAYWPENAKVIQVDIDPRRVGRVKDVTVGIAGDAGLVGQQLLDQLKAGGKPACLGNVDARMKKMNAHKQAWEKELLDMADANQPAAEESGRLVPRKVLRELEKAMPRNAMVATDIGNSCSVSNGYLRFNQPRSYLAALTFGNCGYAFPAAIGAKVGCPDRPSVAYVGDGAFGMSFNELLTCVREEVPTTVVTFNNQQWGAEKKNQVLWFGDRYVGTNLRNPETGFAGIAKATGCRGVTITSLDEVGDALREACKLQESGVTTVIDVHTTKELGDPFRRDAMKLPQRILSKYKDFSEEAESATGQPVDLYRSKTA